MGPRFLYPYLSVTQAPWQFGQILGHFSPSDPGHLLSGSSTGRPYLPARCLAAYPPQNGSCSPSQLGGCGTRVRHRSLAARGNQCLLLAGDGLGADAEGAASPSRLRSFNSAVVDSSPTARDPSLALCVDQRDMSYLPDLYRKYVCSHVLISYLVALFHCSDWIWIAEISGMGQCSKDGHP
jgi:hypothetical protein